MLRDYVRVNNTQPNQTQYPRPKPAGSTQHQNNSKFSNNTKPKKSNEKPDSCTIS